jgi:adenine-specific DNA-methyltransferase
VINGENYHALQLMLHCWERQVDCIYIDPPYNTGARDWKYNNDYVDAADTWRHSKWLSMMEKRLRLARRLLKPDGVLIVTIDEHEVHHLGVLLEQKHLFGGYQRYMVTIVNAPQGNDKANFSRVEEHAFFCVPPSESDLIEGSPIDFVPESGDLDIDPDDEEDGVEESPDGDHYLPSDVEAEGFVSENARRRGNQSLRRDRVHMFFPIYIDEQAREVVRAGPAIPLEEEPSFEKVDGLRPIWPIDSNGHHRRWRWGYERMQRLIEAGEIQLGQHNKKRDTWAINRVQPRKVELKKLKTVWRHTSHNAGTHGSGLLAQMLGQGQAFSFPKSVYATRDCLAAVCRSRPDALIVDFFAGSGTTLHSTLLMNEADGGRRRCVVVTDNEVEERVAGQLTKQSVVLGSPEWEQHGIFELACRPRVEAAITGKRPDGQPIPGKYLDGRPLADGFEANCEFYELEYLHPDHVELGRAFQAVHPLLWLMAGACGKRADDLTPDVPFAVLPEGGYAVLFDEAAQRDFIAGLNQAEGIRHVFLVTDSEDAYAEMAEGVGPGYVTHMLYRDYLRSFRIHASTPA